MGRKKETDPEILAARAAAKRAYHAAYWKEWKTTSKGLAYQEKYRSSGAIKADRKRYESSPKGKVLRSKPEYRAVQKAWQTSPEGKAAHAAAKKKYEAKPGVKEKDSLRRRMRYYGVTDPSLLPPRRPSPKTGSPEER